jgi:hypothetical protein
MYLKQPTIYQEEAFAFAKAMMGERIPGLIKLKINRFQCKCLKSILEGTKIKIKIDTKGSKSLHKDKSSESCPILLRPMYATNFSDAFKYHGCRGNFVSQVNTHSQYSVMDPNVV